MSKLRKFVFNSIITISMAAFGSTGLSNEELKAAGSAGAAGNTALITAGANTAASPPLKASCSGMNFVACAMLALTVAQIGASLLHSGASGRSADALSNTGASGAGSAAATIAPGTYGTNGSAGAGTMRAQDAAALTSMGLGSLVSDYKSLKDAVAQSGVTVSADGSTVKGPNGKTYPSSTFSSAQAMKNAGFGDSQISEAQNALAEGQKRAAAYMSKVASLTNDQGGGGGTGAGGGGGGSGDSGSGRDPFGGLGKRGGAGNGKDKGVAGMSKKLGSDSIGVSGDDIFEMVTRRYQARDKVNTFLKN